MSAKWTVMVYVAGYNNLTEFAGKDLAEMRKVGSGDEVKITAFVKRLEQQASHRIVIGKDGKNEERENLGRDVDSGSPQTLVDFIRWSQAKAPADRYALVIWNHGSGWDPLDFDELYKQVKAAGVTPRELDARAGSQIGRSLFRPTIETALTQPNARLRAIASDDGTGHSLDTIELGSVLKKAHEILGRPVDLLGMDACLMSCLEVAYQAEKDVRAVVSSEELEPGDGWPYDKILADLRSNPSIDGAGLGRIVVKRYIESYKHDEGSWPVTMCAIHSAGIEPFADIVDAFTMALRRTIKDDDVDATRLLRAHTRSTRFDGDLIDLKTLCEQVRAQPFEPAVKNAAKKVMDALKPGGDFVVANANLGESVEHCGGVTAYLPAPTDEISPYYKDLRFAQRHGWDEFLRSYRRAVRGT
ncbi:clostripain-related cysteine peptidase [Solirubrobacter soli]|uniref:clostripain-related cysteine peptidase n=1 Tax=Solirubrobacter soli TaxID=363832 RepID=UPI00041A2A92|nr:clostripain-related cysteine peptidase [Solirubrobacter soli]